MGVKNKIIIYQSMILSRLYYLGKNMRTMPQNKAMVLTYWHVGKRIVEQEQNGKERAEYGSGMIEKLAEELTKEYGKSYSKRNLQYYRRFYLAFPNKEIVNTCVHNLNWSHFRSLLRVPDETARLWYMKEAAEEGWSVRTLDRNISTQYYSRLMQSPKKEAVIAEMQEKNSRLSEKSI